MSCVNRIAYGQKAPFTADDVAAIRKSRVLSSTRDRALFELALSSALRSGDLLSLTVSDVTNASGDVLRDVRKVQEKTGETVRFNVSETARDALQAHIAAYGLTPTQPLFSAARLKDRRPMSTRAFQALVKVWADAAGYRDTSRFAGHSTRRTMPCHAYAHSRDVVAVAKLLGHTSLKYVTTYLNVDEAAALSLARQCEL